MKIIDISWPVSPDITGYKDAVVCAFESLLTFEEHQARTTYISLHSHTGTHIDAPSHFVENGATIDQIPLQALCGPCIVLDASLCSIIDISFLKQATSQADLKQMRVLFKTKASDYAPTDKFDYSFTQIDLEAAQWLVQANVMAVGIDYLGIEIGKEGHPSHKAFLKQAIPIIEGLRLQEVSAGQYMLFCLPVRIIGLDGAPARAILIPPNTP